MSGPAFERGIHEQRKRIESGKTSRLPSETVLAFIYSTWCVFLFFVSDRITLSQDTRASVIMAQDLPSSVHASYARKRTVPGVWHETNEWIGKVPTVFRFWMRFALPISWRNRHLVDRDDSMKGMHMRICGRCAAFKIPRSQKSRCYTIGGGHRLSPHFLKMLF